jgi:hypothetical protein
MGIGAGLDPQHRRAGAQDDQDRRRGIHPGALAQEGHHPEDDPHDSEGDHEVDDLGVEDADIGHWFISVLR